MQEQNAARLPASVPAPCVRPVLSCPVRSGPVRSELVIEIPDIRTIALLRYLHAAVLAKGALAIPPAEEPPHPRR